MIASLLSLSRSDAVGILARTALALGNEANPAAELRLPGELGIRHAIISEVRRSIGASDVDDSDLTIEKVAEAIDRELDALTNVGSLDSVLESLSNQGKLPSDLYGIHVIENVSDIYKKHWFRERQNIERTVRAADREQHFLPAPGAEGPPLVSLFARSFPDKYPGNSFTMLVIGQRTELRLDVHLAWRLYSDRVKMNGATDLLDLFRRFSAEYGLEFKVRGVQGKFFLEMNNADSLVVAHDIEVLPVFIRDARGRKVGKAPRMIVSVFTRQSLSGASLTSLINVVDLDRYQSTLDAHGW